MAILGSPQIGNQGQCCFKWWRTTLHYTSVTQVPPTRTSQSSILQRTGRHHGHGRLTRSAPEAEEIESPRSLGTFAMTKILTIDCFYIAWRHEMRREMRSLPAQEAAPERVLPFTFEGPMSALAD